MTEKKNIFDLPLLLALVVILFSRGLMNPDVGWPDADRILMDGLFMHDLLHDIPFQELFHPNGFHTAYQYALQYFAHYPALSLGARPPLFPLVEALFFTLFGVHDWSGKLSIIAFAMLGTIAWYDLIRRSYDRQTALLATGLLFTTPFIVQWGWYPMLEIPILAMTLLTANLFWRYTATGNQKTLFLAALSFSMTLWTKQAALFTLLWFLPWLALSGRLKTMIVQKSTWGAVILPLILTLPVGIMTVWMGKMNLAVTLQGMDPALQGLGLLDWEYLRQYIDILLQKQLTLPVLSLAALGLASAAWHRDRTALFYLLLILSTYIFFTTIRTYRIDRYTIFWVPAFCLFATLPWYHWRHHTPFRRLGWLLILLVIAWQIREVQAKTPAFTSGYQDAARIAATQSRHGMIFMDGVNNGYFTYFVRLNDPDKRLSVLRGDKLLHSSAIFADSWTEVHVKTLNEIKTIFDQYGIDIIVVEEANYANLEIHRLLREFLKTDLFEPIRAIPIESTRSQLAHQTLHVYRYKEAKPPSIKEFSMSIPLVGMRFQLPVGAKTDPQSP
ncbi:MAG: glycosyltransferase family 39 protein [Magnetococcus sp. YQC-5]